MRLWQHRPSNATTFPDFDRHSTIGSPTIVWPTGFPCGNSFESPATYHMFRISVRSITNVLLYKFSAAPPLTGHGKLLVLRRNRIGAGRCHRIRMANSVNGMAVQNISTARLHSHVTVLYYRTTYCLLQSIVGAVESRVKIAPSRKPDQEFVVFSSTLTSWWAQHRVFVKRRSIIRDEEFCGQGIFKRSRAD